MKLKLTGPFRLSKRFELQNIISIQIENIVIENEDFIKLDMESSGAKPEDREDWNEPMDVNLNVQIEWFYSKPEPNNGWTGGNELDSWEPIGINGIILESSDDKNIIHSLLNKRVEEEILKMR